MKTLIKPVTLILVFTSVLLACHEEINNNPVDEQSVNLEIPHDMGGLTFHGVVLPNGTLSELSDDGSSLNVRLPGGMIYVALLNNELIEADEGGWTCTSTCNGCDVVKLGTEVGCSRCAPGSTASCTGEDPTQSNGFYSIGQGSGGGFIDLNQGISLVKHSDGKLENFQAPQWDVLMQHPEVQHGLKTFIQKLWPKGEVDEVNSSLALANVFGTYIQLRIPNNDSQAKLSNDVVLGDDVSCGCKEVDVSVLMKILLQGG